MDHKKDQGHLEQMEQKWVCPDCETVNSGNNCAVCGCLRPQKKREESVQETATEQGGYQDTVPEWICPDCETHNTGAVCAVCGRPRPEPEGEKNTGEPENTSGFPPVSDSPAENNASAAGFSGWLQRFPLSKRAVIAAAACLVILALAAAGISKLPYWDYRSACDLLENGQYQQAYQAFSDLGTYRNAEQYASDAAIQWIRQTLDASDLPDARQIRNTVSLNPEQSQIVYRMLCDKDVYTYTDDHGNELFSCNPNDFRVRSLLAETLAAGSCTDMTELKKLFSGVNLYNPSEFVLTHRDILETLWYVPVVRNIVSNHLCIMEWLHGSWMTEDHRYYLRFWAGSDNTTKSDFTLPWLEKPLRTEYFTIRNMTYSWTDKDDVVLLDVFRFTLLEPDRIEVYAFKDQNTYTMVRK